jgi:4-diphosphocytidyl-2-C-methyl-D-erythritol kinase
MTAVRAPAKLTWSLHVVGRRSDGLHLLDAEMVTLDLADSLDLEAATADEPLRRSVVLEAPATDRGVKLGDSDLVDQALHAVGRRAHVALVKRIPLSAGLGGGSADAAAVLRWAGVDDLDVALRLGSDVPFCVLGGHAGVHGVGELLEPLAPLRRTVTLALPAFGVDTASAYDAFDALPARRRRHGRNDLTAAAEVVAPALGTLREQLDLRTGMEFVLAGSGSTLFCEGDPLGLRGGPGEVLETVDGPVRLLAATTD